MTSSQTRLFTKQELQLYDGTDAKRALYVALNGKVYDVSSGAKFYGHGGAYEILAGKDATRVLAQMDMKAPREDCTVSDLTADQRGSLNEWIAKFDSKYPTVGTLPLRTGPGPARAVAPAPVPTTTATSPAAAAPSSAHASCSSAHSKSSS